MTAAAWVHRETEPVAWTADSAQHPHTALFPVQVGYPSQYGMPGVSLTLAGSVLGTGAGWVSVLAYRGPGRCLSITLACTFILGGGCREVPPLGGGRRSRQE